MISLTFKCLLHHAVHFISISKHCIDCSSEMQIYGHLQNYVHDKINSEVSVTKLEGNPDNKPHWHRVLHQSKSRIQGAS